MKERILSKFHDQNDLKTNKKVYIAILDSLILIIFSVILTISGLELIKLSPHYNELNTTLNEERDTCYDITSESKLYTYIEDENNEKTVEDLDITFARYAYRHIIYAYEKDPSSFLEYNITIKPYEDFTYEAATFYTDQLAYFYVYYVPLYNEYNGQTNDIVDFNNVEPKQYFINLLKDHTYGSIFVFDDNNELPYLRSEVALNIYRYYFLNEESLENGLKNYNFLISTFKAIWEIEAKQLTSSSRYQEHYVIYKDIYRTLSIYVTLICLLSYLISFLIFNFSMKFILKDGRTLGYLICRGALISKEGYSPSFIEILIRSTIELFFYFGNLVFISYFATGLNSGFFYPLVEINGSGISMFSISAMFLLVPIINLLTILIRKDKLSLIDLASKTKSIDIKNVNKQHLEIKDKKAYTEEDLNSSAIIDSSNILDSSSFNNTERKNK